MSKIDKKTEREILQELLPVIRDYSSRLPVDGNFDLETCISRQIAYLQKLYKGSWGVFARKLNSLQRQTLETLSAHFAPMIREQTLPFMEAFNKKKTVYLLHETTALAIIPSAFQTAGLDAEVFCQRSQAKVYVSVTPRRTLCFAVRYRDLGKEGLMDELVAAVLDCRKALTRLGGNASVR